MTKPTAASTQRLLLCLAATALAACEGAPFDVEHSLQASNVNQPWVGRIALSSTYLCTATIIDAHSALTTASCLEGRSTKNLSLIVGTDTLGQDPTATSYDVDEIVVYEGYNPDLIASGDLALVRLSQPINFSADAQPIALATDDSLDAPYALVTEFGWRPPAQPITSFSKYVVSLQQAQTEWNAQIDSSVLPIAVTTEDCVPSVGDPIVANDSSGTPTLQGVVSVRAAKCNASTLSTRVSSFVQWILANSDAAQPPPCNRGVPVAPSVCLTSTGHPGCWYFSRNHTASPVLQAGQVNLSWHAAGNVDSYVVQRFDGTNWVDMVATQNPIPASATTATVLNQGAVNFTTLQRLRVQARNVCGAVSSNEIQIRDVRPSYTADMKKMWEDRPNVSYGEQCASCHSGSRLTDPSGAACYSRTSSSPASLCNNEGRVLGGLALDGCNPTAGQEAGPWKLVDAAIGNSSTGVLWSLTRRVFTATHDVSGNPSEAATSTTPSLHPQSTSINAFICKGASGSNPCSVAINNRLNVKLDPAAGSASPTYYSRNWWPKVSTTNVSLQMPARYDSGSIHVATDTTAGPNGPNSLHPLSANEKLVADKWVEVAGASCY
jgi:hypothetical protein